MSNKNLFRVRLSTIALAVASALLFSSCGIEAEPWAGTVELEAKDLEIVSIRGDKSGYVDVTIVSECGLAVDFTAFYGLDTDGTRNDTIILRAWNTNQLVLPEQFAVDYYACEHLPQLGD